MNFLITNSVPLNGGDEALLRATIGGIQRRWPQGEVYVLCNDLERCRRQLPDLHLASDLEFAVGADDRRKTLDLYRAADIILSAPGGFLHDHYKIEDRLRGFEIALGFGKPVVLFAQSVGPFWRADSLKRVPQVLNRLSRICVRDQVSTKYLLACGVEPSKIRETADAAFLWRELAPDLFRSDEKPNHVVGLSFRLWPLDDSVAVEGTICKAERLCRHILDKPHREILFLSTCQGIPGYVDDSLLALRIVERLPQDLQPRCRIDRARYAPRDLIRELGQCSAFIGMRLHACILAMMAGVPAAGLGYETKTEEIFRQLGFSPYQTGFDTQEPDWLSCADRLLDSTDMIRRQLPGALDRLCARANTNFDVVGEEMGTVRSKGADPQQGRWSRSVRRYSAPHLRLRQVATLVRQLAPKRMLDLGCAEGYLHELCPDVEYVGADFVASGSEADFEFYPCNFNRQRLPEQLGGFDLVVCSGILEYIEDLPAFLADLNSRLAADGYLIGTYFNMNHVSRIWGLLRGRSFPVHTDWRGFYSLADLRANIEASGFRIVKVVPMNHSFRTAVPVEQTVSTPLVLPEYRSWSPRFAHQFLFVARTTGAGERSCVQEIISAVPAGRPFILVDGEQFRHRLPQQCQAMPFLEHEGEYWGPPEDDNKAISELERMHKAGAELIVFAAPAFWWLDYYRGFDKYLRSRCSRLLENERLIVFDLQHL